ncbi:MAG: ribonuclease III [Calditrichaeota bacterium]|nr:MAG: ribonuclease III [Calditrichota bacterium]
MLNWLKRPFSKLFSKQTADLPKIDFTALKEIIGYEFNNPQLLVQALKHRSYLPIAKEERICSNERLELLGDAVLALVVVDFLYHRYPQKEEGELTSMKSLVVSRRILARVARALNLGNFILISEAEEKSGGRNRASIIADAMEALIGAIYLDGGLDRAREFIEQKILSNFDEIVAEDLHKNFKSMLLEYAQSKNLGAPYYKVQSVDGPDHEKIFTVEVKIQDNVLGVGSGSSKKLAEQRAAQEALRNLYLI